MLTIDQEAHRYAWCGMPIPSVNDLLVFSGESDPDMIPAAGLALGQETHRLTLTLDLHGPEAIAWATLEPRLRARLLAYQDAITSEGLRLTAWEQPVGPGPDPARPVGGRYDRGGYTASREPFLLEIKNGAPSRAHGIQLAFYDWLDGRYPPGVRIRYGLYLSPRGAWKLRRYPSRADYVRAQQIHQQYYRRQEATLV